MPIKNEKNQVVLFLASHKDITVNKCVIKTFDTLTVPGFDSDSDDDFLNGRQNGGGGSGSDPEFASVAKNLGADAPANYNYGRRRSRAVLYQLSGHYKNTEKSSKNMHSGHVG